MADQTELDHYCRVRMDQIRSSKDKFEQRMTATCTAWVSETPGWLKMFYQIRWQTNGNCTVQLPFLTLQAQFAGRTVTDKTTLLEPGNFKPEWVSVTGYEFPRYTVPDGNCFCTGEYWGRYFIMHRRRIIHSVQSNLSLCDRQFVEGKIVFETCAIDPSCLRFGDFTVPATPSNISFERYKYCFTATSSNEAVQSYRERQLIDFEALSVALLFAGVRHPVTVRQLRLRHLKLHPPPNQPHPQLSTLLPKLQIVWKLPIEIQKVIIDLLVDSVSLDAPSKGEDLIRLHFPFHAASYISTVPARFRRWLSGVCSKENLRHVGTRYLGCPSTYLFVKRLEVYRLRSHDLYPSFSFQPKRDPRCLGKIGHDDLHLESMPDKLSKAILRFFWGLQKKKMSYPDLRGANRSIPAIATSYSNLSSLQAPTTVIEVPQLMIEVGRDPWLRSDNSKVEFVSSVVVLYGEEMKSICDDLEVFMRPEMFVQHEILHSPHRSVTELPEWFGYWAIKDSIFVGRELVRETERAASSNSGTMATTMV